MESKASYYLNSTDMNMTDRAFPKLLQTIALEKAFGIKAGDMSAKVTSCRVENLGE
jgi:hypothetical protein